jgi:hypothetical protein
MQGAYYEFFLEIRYYPIPYSSTTYSHYYVSIQCCILHQSGVLPVSLYSFIFEQLEPTLVIARITQNLAPQSNHPIMQLAIYLPAVISDYSTCFAVITWYHCHLCFVQTEDRRWLGLGFLIKFLQQQQHSKCCSMYIDMSPQPPERQQR